MTAKKKGSKAIKALVFNQKGSQWTVHFGKLNGGPGNPGSARLFQVLGEKLPFDALNKVKQYLKTEKPEFRRTGVYIAHDSMGEARYIGRGNIFTQLADRKKSTNWNSITSRSMSWKTRNTNGKLRPC